MSERVSRAAAVHRAQPRPPALEVSAALPGDPLEHTVGFQSGEAEGSAEGSRCSDDSGNGNPA